LEVEEEGYKIMTLPNVSVITVNFNSKKFLKKFFSSLYGLNYPKKKLELLMVDNNPLDGSAEYTRRHYPRVKVIRNRQNNYCRANNLGIRASRGRFVAMVNNDTVVDKNWLAPLVDTLAQDKRVAAAGSKILFMDGKIQSTGHQEFPYHYWGDRGFLEDDHQQYDKKEEVPSISNCSALYRRDALERIGFFDEDFNMYMEDVDILFRLRKKRWKVVYVPQSRIYHRLFGSGQSEDERKFLIEKNRLLFVAKHYPRDLSKMVLGTGELPKLGDDQIKSLTSAVFMKLAKLYGKHKGKVFFGKMQESLFQASSYAEHCARTELKQHMSSLQALNKQITIQQSIIAEKDQQLDSRQGALLERDHRLSVQQGVISEKAGQISSQQEAILQKDQEISSFTSNINELSSQLESLNSQLQNLREQLDSQQGVISIKEEQISSQHKAIADFKSNVENLREQLDIQQGVISVKEKQINSQYEAILQKDREIAKIFTSQTYRFIVRPIIWPFFSLIKKIMRVFKIKVILSAPKRGRRGFLEVGISELSTRGVTAKYRRKNEYRIKLSNTGFKKKEVKLVVDIWPHHNSHHPQRHFAYFAVKLVLQPRSSDIVKLDYDWERDAKFYFGDAESPIEKIDFWRGQMKTMGMYLLYATLYNVGEKELDRSDQIDEMKVMQRLEE